MKIIALQFNACANAAEEPEAQFLSAQSCSSAQSRSENVWKVKCFFFHTWFALHHGCA